MDLKGILFDLDGVLIDTESIYSTFWDEIDRRFPTGIDRFSLYIKGTTLPSIMTHFPDEDVRRQIMEALERFQDSMSYPLYDDTLDFLDMLAEAGLKLAINTSSDPYKMSRLYAEHPGFRDRFDAVIDASNVTRSKPDPQGYIMAAHALGLEPCQCVVFEDSLQGLAAGATSGAKVVGVATTYPAGSLMPPADVVISRLSEMTLDRLRSL